jgi:hypothetical protein
MKDVVETVTSTVVATPAADAGNGLPSLLSAVKQKDGAAGAAPSPLATNHCLQISASNLRYCFRLAL